MNSPKVPNIDSVLWVTVYMHIWPGECHSFPCVVVVCPGSKTCLLFHGTWCSCTRSYGILFNFHLIFWRPSIVIDGHAVSDRSPGLFPVHWHHWFSAQTSQYYRIRHSVHHIAMPSTAAMKIFWTMHNIGQSLQNSTRPLPHLIQTPATDAYRPSSVNLPINDIKPSPHPSQPSTSTGILGYPGPQVILSESSTSESCCNKSKTKQI